LPRSFPRNYATRIAIGVLLLAFGVASALVAARVL
jgi:hypothetical protein